MYLEYDVYQMNRAMIEDEGEKKETRVECGKMGGIDWLEVQRRVAQRMVM